MPIPPSAEPAVLAPAEADAVNPNPDPSPEPLQSAPAPTGAQPLKRFFPLDPRSVRAEQFSGLIFFAVLALAATFGLVIGFIAADRINWIWWAVAGGLATGACILLFFVLAWPAIEFRHARWSWDASGLEIHRGVLWQHRITIPISRIQHVDVSQGPLQRHFGLGKVTVHTAGTQHAAIELSGIAYEAATWLREQIIAGQGVQDAV
jgi:membrane protein YdbS with pleckstrin-like domain